MYIIYIKATTKIAKPKLRANKQKKKINGIVKKILNYKETREGESRKQRAK